MKNNKEKMYKKFVKEHSEFYKKAIEVERKKAEREAKRNIIAKRVLARAPGESLRTIGIEFGISHERVRQIAVLAVISTSKKVPRIAKKCRQCGIVFFIRPCMNETIFSCSNKCKKEFNHQRMLARKAAPDYDIIRKKKQNERIKRYYWENLAGTEAFKQKTRERNKRYAEKIKAKKSLIWGHTVTGKNRN